jgi:L-threonylcarbamoyladenylate synthase
MSIISNNTASAIKDAATSLLKGNFVAFPTETVYGLGADAQNKNAVARIYQVKGRPVFHPLIVHISSIQHLDKLAKDIPDYAIALARAFWPGTMTLILPRTVIVKDFITGSQNNVGIRVPSNTFAIALLKEFELQGGLGVAAPSANRFGKVSPTTANDVKIELSGYLGEEDLVLDGGPSIVGVESTIVNCTLSVPTILRPGAITASMINKLLDSSIEVNSQNVKNSIKVSGLLESHYAPSAKVYLFGTPKPGDGFIALDTITTPMGAIRLANPASNEEYARVLYQALRLADAKNLDRVFVVPPTGDNIEVAIRDRLEKCATKS